MKKIFTIFSLLLMCNFQAYTQTIQIDGGACTLGLLTLDPISSASLPEQYNDKNAYGNPSAGLIVYWDNVDNRWEISGGFGPDVAVAWYNTTATTSNPPELGFGTWVNAGLGCDDLVQFNGTGVVLPVELMFFRFEKYENSIVFNWQTASELNNEKFEVEHSSNGLDFKKIGEVAGSGSSFDINRYEFTDDNALRGINYYRLKQIDFDGAFDYSDIISVNMNEDKSHFRIAPNPTSGSGTIALSFEDSNAKKITIYNSLGAKVYQTIAEENQSNIEINLPNLPQGIYTVEFLSGRVRTTKRMFVK